MIVHDTTVVSVLLRAEPARQAAGRPISQFDCQIAAIALAHGASVATRNVGDFKGCGIDLLDPWGIKPQ